MKRIRNVFAGLLLFFAGVAAVSAQSKEEIFRDWEIEYSNGIAAIVEGKIITKEELRQKMAPIMPQIYRESRTPVEFRQNADALAREILQNEIDKVLIVKAFNEQDEMQIPATIVKNEFENALAEQFDGDRGKLLEHLREQNKTVSDFTRDIREEIIVSVMRSRNRQSQAEVSPERIEAFYNEHKIRFYEEESIRMRQIVLVPYADESEQLLLQNAQKIIEELNNGANFADMARKYSQDDMARRGGDWGWIEESDIREELADIAFSLQEGEFSEPFVFNNQVFILYVEDRRDEGIQPLQEVRDSIERFIVSEISRENQERWLARLRADGYVKYYL